jgi:hypothetical protein
MGELQLSFVSACTSAGPGGSTLQCFLGLPYLATSALAWWAVLFTAALMLIAFMDVLAVTVVPAWIDKWKERLDEQTAAHLWVAQVQDACRRLSNVNLYSAVTVLCVVVPTVGIAVFIGSGVSPPAEARAQLLTFGTNVLRTAWLACLLAMVTALHRGQRGSLGCPQRSAGRGCGGRRRSTAPCASWLPSLSGGAWPRWRQACGTRAFRRGLIA